MKAAQQSFTRLDTRTGTETHTESYTVSTKSLIKPWTWFNSDETRYYTTSRSYSYLATSDAVAKIVSYEEDCIAQLTTQFAALISPKTLRINLGRALVGVLNSNSPDFDPAAFRSTLEGTVRRLEIPRLQIALSDTANLIAKHWARCLPASPRPSMPKCSDSAPSSPSCRPAWASNSLPKSTPKWHRSKPPLPTEKPLWRDTKSCCLFSVPPRKGRPCSC